MKNNQQAQSQEIILTGQGVSEGIAMGRAHVREAMTLSIPQRTISSHEIGSEMARFQGSIEKAKDQLDKLQKRTNQLPNMAAEEIGYLLEAHVQILSSGRLLDGVRKRITDEHINAEAAVKVTMDDIIHAFGHIDADFSANQILEIREVGNRLIRNLTNTSYVSYKDLEPDTILMAEHITPADTAGMDPKLIRAFATSMGGYESHSSIMARSMALPAVVGIQGLLDKIKTGDPIIVDGYEGRIIANPTVQTHAHYQRRLQEESMRTRIYAEVKNKTSTTLDGVPVVLRVNMENSADYKAVKEFGAEGVGLWRSEFKFMSALTPPTEDDQYAEIMDMLDVIDGAPLYVRMFDFGADKPANFLDQTQHASVNPSMGLRAIRLQMKDRDLFRHQVMAILRASVEGDVRVTIPMISSIGEIRMVKTMMEQLRQELAARGSPYPEKLPPVGIMIEVPSAAVVADLMAKEADFFSIGSNDLTMYTLAVDRADENVSYLYNPLNPAVVRLIYFTHQAGRQAKIPVSMCGEMAGDPRYTGLIIGFGARELSMAPSVLPKLKNRLLKIDSRKAEALAKAVLAASSEEKIIQLVDSFNQSLDV